MALQLRGGLGNLTIGYNVKKLKPTKKTQEKAIQETRDRNAAQFDFEAELEAHAIRTHKNLAPAREIARGRAV